MSVTLIDIAVEQTYKYKSVQGRQLFAAPRAGLSQLLVLILPGVALRRSVVS